MPGLLVLMWGSTAQGDPDRVFTIRGEPPIRIAFSLRADSVTGPALDTEMGRTLAGVLGELDGHAAAEAYRLIAPESRPREDVAMAQRICVAWLFGADDRPPKRIEIGRTDEDWLLARELDAEEDGVDAARLMEVRFGKLSEQWPAFRGVLGAKPTEPPGEMVKLAKPYIASPILLDDQTLSRRIYGRRPSDVPELDRDLMQEQMFVRLPKGYDPARPAGLLIWIHATSSGVPPLDVLKGGLDELGLICASIENAGNTRDIVNRFQLVLDCAATVRARYLIDDERIYLSGISGGGRSASMLWACFPDVCTGAIPIVGVNSYALAPTGTGTAWPKNFVRPTGRFWSELRTHRLAAISGARDFNFPEIKVRIAGMHGDGLDVRLIEQEGMEHEMPRPEVFAEALRWVDQPARDAADERENDARRLLDRAARMRGDGRTRLLTRVMDEAPWSSAAFEAYDLLRDDQASHVE